MATEKFERTKPHITFGVTALARDLDSRGISTRGTRQLLFGHAVTSPADRKLISELIRELLCQSASGADQRVRT